MAAVVLPPLLPSTTSWEGVLVSVMDGTSLSQAISDLGDDRPIPGSLINRRARLLEVLSFYEARPVRVMGVVPFTMDIVNDILAGTFAWDPEAWLLAGLEDDEEEEVAGEADLRESGSDSEEASEDVDWISRVKALERENQRLRKKASKGKRVNSSRRHKASKRRRKSRSSSDTSGSDSDFSSGSSSSSGSSDNERLNLGQDFVPDLLDRKHERFHVLLRDLRSACAASATSWSSAVRVFPSLASRPLFVRELQLVERAGIKAGVLTSRQRRNWASTIASIQDSVGPMEAEMFIFRRLFGDLGESREDRGVRSRRERIRRKFLKDRKLLAASAAVEVGAGVSSSLKSGG
ncbi:hypothetical protein BC829DRAFT_449850, partial [Chytridium lagenaria]